ncbi:MAG: carbohydrate ABC transporter permease [Ardenticatenaceae bacterium]|nr:carbohydrate ABC transporter permease [Ardenticatenaceae bacterium]HBY97921.1 sugar ABC transporter ATP-binding protein [Chloroflexota bacterium]
MIQSARIGYSWRRRLSRGAIHLLLILGAVVVLFPLFWMLNTSLKPLPQTRAYPPVFIPHPFVWRNYIDALTLLPFQIFFRNTLIISIAVIIGELLSSSFVAYGFARLSFPGRDILFLLLVSTMIIPFIVRLVPLFLIFKKLGWINTFLPLIVPSYFGTAFFIFLMRQFYLTIPEDLLDAARVDGANEFTIWWRVMVPLSKPALMVVAVLAFQHTWNDFLAPLIYLNDTDKFTAALGLVSMLSQSGASTEYWNYLMAVATTMVAPLLVLYVIGQRYLVQGIVLTGIKG